MKVKHLKLLIPLLLISASFAETSIDLQKQPILCANYQITEKSLPFDIAKNCKVKEIKRKSSWIFNQHLKVKFYSDNIEDKLISCDFKNNKLVKCELEN